MAHIDIELNNSPIKRSRASENPDMLVLQHIKLVHKIAWHMYRRLNRNVEIEDIIQVGSLGLIDASKRYVPQSGVNFVNYAQIRIRGAIIDFLRSNSNLCRASISMYKKEKVVSARLEQKLMRTPTLPEIAEALSIPQDEYAKWQVSFAKQNINSLDETYSDYSPLFQNHSLSAEETIHQGERKAALKTALTYLSKRELQVLTLYYVEGMNVYEISKILSVTRGRVSQIKKHAAERLRANIPKTHSEEL